LRNADPCARWCGGGGGGDPPPPPPPATGSAAVVRLNTPTPCPPNCATVTIPPAACGVRPRHHSLRSRGAKLHCGSIKPAHSCAHARRRRHPWHGGGALETVHTRAARAAPSEPVAQCRAYILPPPPRPLPSRLSTRAHSRVYALVPRDLRTADGMYMSTSRDWWLDHTASRLPAPQHWRRSAARRHRRLRWDARVSSTYIACGEHFIGGGRGRQRGAAPACTLWHASASSQPPRH
jgi:hypothetical protein